MLRFLLSLATLLLAPIASAQDAEYSIGQVWEYRTAPGDDGSLIKIQDYELIGPTDNQLEVFHISMINLSLPDGTMVPEIMHLPVSRQTLDDSVTEISASQAAFPDHREGMAIWREANGGVFTITLAEIANLLRDQVASQLPSPTKQGVETSRLQSR